MTDKKMTGVRFADDVREELEKLCDLTGLSKTAMLTYLVRQEYNRLYSDPVMSDLQSQLEKFQSALAEMSDKLREVAKA